MKKDSIFSKPMAEVKDFAFDSEVVEVFDDMISRSVPLYQEVQALSVQIVETFYQPGTAIYDLGCSTGTSLINIYSTMGERIERIVGVDNSPAMLKHCRERLASLGITEKIELTLSNIQEVSLLYPSVILLNYTLQFIPPNERLLFLSNICRQLLPGGAVVLSEKIIHQNPALNELAKQLHFDFKKRAGYSELEIAQKRESLERVLFPTSIEENINLLRQAGFSQVEIFLKWYNFATIVAIC